jgi:hypothetical protein
LRAACSTPEKFEEDYFFPRSDFYGEGVVLPDYTDEQLRSYLEVPFALPIATREVTARLHALNELQLGVAYGMGAPPKTTTS